MLAMHAQTMLESPNETSGCRGGTAAEKAVSLTTSFMSNRTNILPLPFRKTVR